MLNGVLDNRLKQKTRHLLVEQPLGCIDRKDQSIAEAHVHDVEIELRQLELPAERRLLTVIAGKRSSEHVA